MKWFCSLYLNNTLCRYATFSLSIHLSLGDGHLGWVHDLAVVNTTMINMDVQLCLLNDDFDFLGVYPEVV
jgi:hypothetical protein